MLRRTSALLGVLACVVAAACNDGSSSSPEPVVACDSAAAPAGTDSFDPTTVGVYLDASDPLLSRVQTDLASTLGTMWGASVSVTSGPPDGSKPVSLWLSTSPAAATAMGSPPPGLGYGMRRIDANGATTLLVYAVDAADLATGAYAMLEQLGARFFHPKESFVPQLGTALLPHTLDVWRTPVARRRGLQPHTLHPIEYFHTFMEPSAANLADAKLFVDWLVETGQNYMQWPLLATVDWNSWAPHAQAILDYAHSRGVSIGALPELYTASALQNNFVLVSDTSKWQAEMASGLDQILTLPFDVVEFDLGEFVGFDPQSVIDWLDYGTDYILEKYPGVEANVENHVGNYPDLWVQYRGQTVFFYHLPEYCDQRLGQDVHTLSVFDLYRDWATYAHPNFFLQHDYILQEIPQRRVTYIPESAYWISADIDVPLFLPMTIYSRWNDIHTLSAELTDDLLPPLEGHVTFSTGHEWGYWMTDYLTAKMLWQASEPLETFVDHYAAAYGSCSADISAALSSFIQLENTYLFDQRLFAYVQGEDATVDEGYIAGLETHPQRVEFEDLLPMTPDQLETFVATVVTPLASFAAQVQPIEDTVAARCRGADATLAPWCNELWDGIEIVRLRAQHAVLLYQSILAYVAGQDGTGLLAQAQAVTPVAAQVNARREAGYRFDVNVLTGQYPNATIYAFGYLRQAHTQCYYTRREQQVSFILQNGVAEGLTSLPSCQD
jgi:hypothetical protein